MRECRNGIRFHGLPLLSCKIFWSPGACHFGQFLGQSRRKEPIKCQLWVKQWTLMCQLWFSLQLLHPGMARLLRIVRLFRLVKIASRQVESRKQSKFYSKFWTQRSDHFMNWPNPSPKPCKAWVYRVWIVPTYRPFLFHAEFIFSHLFTSYFAILHDGMGLSLVMCHRNFLAPSPAQPSWSPGPASWLWRLHTWSVWALMKLPMLGFSQMVVVIRLSWQMWSLRTKNDWLLTIGQWQSQRGLLCSCMVLGNILVAIFMWQTSL